MKFRLFTVFAAAGFLLAGCAMEEAPMEGGSIAAVMEDIQTRTAVTDQGIFTWSAGDKVWLEITANPGYVTGTLSTGAGTGSANFAYGSYFGDMTGKAIYPFSTGHDISGDQLSVVLPATYDLGSNLGNTNAAMYGVETSGKIKFNHLAGVMRFNFRSVPAGVNKFVITLDKKINGTFTADLTEDHPVLQTESTSDESEKTITLNFDDLTQTQDINIYVPLPLGTYTTLELALMDDEETVWDYSNTITNTVNRKSLLLMPTVNVTGSISGDLEGGDVVEGENPSDAQEGDYVDEYGINHGQGVEIDGVIWAPVNCGYHETDYKYGKLYQWGRKYGQGYDSNDASVPSIVRGPVSLSIGQSASNADIFYPNSSYDFYSPCDWLDPQNDALWNSGTLTSPVKTDYDPCPRGWRVPSHTELNALKANKSSWTNNGDQNGYWFSGGTYYSESVCRVFFPAAGSRYYLDGTANSRGSYGHYWSLGSDNNCSYDLTFSSSDVYISYNSYRSWGFSVRCVREDSMLEVPDVPEEPSEPTPSQPSYSVQLNPATYGWVESSTVSNPDPSLYDGVYESTNQGVVNSKSIMYIDIDGYDSFTFYVRSYGESSYDYVQVSTLDGDFTDGTKLTTSGIQNSGTSLSSYTEVKFTNIGGGQHRIMVAYRKDDSVNKNDDKGYVLIPKNQENSSSDSGLEEDLEFDPDKCIYYRSNTTGGWDTGYNNYRATSSYITCNASGTTIEMKFKISPSNSSVFIAAGNNRAKDACDTFEIRGSALSLYIDDGEDWFSEGWSLSDAGVTSTDLITLRLSAQDQTMTINGVELPCEGLESMSWTYIFSSYYREYDEGEWKEYEGVPDGSELYYVKMYDSNGELTYFGYAAKAMNPASSQVEYCWYSSSNGVEKYQFANDSANKGGYLGNF